MEEDPGIQRRFTVASKKNADMFRSMLLDATGVDSDEEEIPDLDEEDLNDDLSADGSSPEGSLDCDEEDLVGMNHSLYHLQTKLLQAPKIERPKLKKQVTSLDCRVAAAHAASPLRQGLNQSPNQSSTPLNHSTTPATSPSPGNQDARLDLSGATIPHKLNGMYHKAALSQDTHLTSRFFPFIGNQAFARPIAGLEAQPGHMPKGWQGPKKLNQDRGVVAYPVQGDHKAALIGVFDGHGVEGQRVAETAIVKLAERFQSSPLLNNIPGLLTTTFKTIDEAVKKSPTIDSMESGATACVLYIQQSTLYTAVLGDSRAVAGREVESPEGKYLEAFRLTEDQKPDLPSEKARILKAGGWVSEESQRAGAARVYLTKGSDEGGLAVSRAIGDHMFRKSGIIAVPVVSQQELPPETKAIIVASDGLWEFVEDQQAVNIVSKYPSASRAATALMDEAKLQWKKKGGGYQDDVTIGVFYLPLWHESEAAVTKAAPPIAAVPAPLCPPFAPIAPSVTSIAPASSDSDSDSEDDMAAMIMAAAAKGAKKPVEIDLRAHLAKQLGA